MVMNGLTAAATASKSLNHKVAHHSPSDWVSVDLNGPPCKKVAIVTDSLSLHTGDALPFLSQLKNRASVIHIGVIDHAHLSGIPESTPGCAVLHSATPQEAYDMAICSHAIQHQQGESVIHLIDSVRASFALASPVSFSTLPEDDHHSVSHSLMDDSASSSSDEKRKRKHLVDEVDQIFAKFNVHNHTSYRAFEYFGSPTASHVVVATTGFAHMCIEWMKRQARLHKDLSDLGVVLVRVSSPWSPTHFLHGLPDTVRTVLVLEDVLHGVTASLNSNRNVEVISTKPVSFHDLNKLFHRSEESLPLKKSVSNLIHEVLLFGNQHTMKDLHCAQILGTSMGLHVQDFESRHVRTQVLRKEVRFSALDISLFQFPISRADVVVVESPGIVDESVLQHIGVDTVLVLANGTEQDLTPHAQLVLSHIPGVKLFSIEAELLLRKHDVECVDFVLLAAALFLCPSYAQIHVHLSKQLLSSVGETEQSKKLAQELSESNLFAALKPCVKLHQDSEPYFFEYQNMECAFSPVLPSEGSEEKPLERAEDVLNLLDQLFPHKVVRMQTSKNQSVETHLGHFLNWSSAEKAEKSRWILARASQTVNLQGIHQLLQTEEGVALVFLCADQQCLVARDVGLYAMNYGNAYVASVCLEMSHSQSVKAFTEAERFRTRGPSILLCYVGKASGHSEWPLYRWNPHVRVGCDPFALDSAKLKADLHEFLKRDQHLSLLARREPRLNANLTKSHSAEWNKRGQIGLQHYEEKKRLAQSFSSLKTGMEKAAVVALNLLILYGSDGGKGATVAESLARRAETGQCGEVRVMEANEFKVDDLENETAVIFVISTAGQGEDCANAKHFTQELLASKTKLPKMKFAVFGLGDSHYWGEGSADSAKYFCMPARRIFQKLKELGAHALVQHEGLGDDQHDDGYDGALSEWEPLVWKALNVSVKKVAGPKVPTDDEIKIESNYLRGTIAEGLADLSTSKLVFEDTKLTKFHGIYQQDDRELREEMDAKGLERAYTFMIRIGVPGGVASAQQYLDMDALCEKYATGRLKITTRQAYQFHGIVKKDLKLTMQGINQACMDTLAACGDVHRNIIANPRVHDGEVYVQVAQLSQAINAHLKPRTTAYHEVWLDRKPVAGYVDHEPLYGRTYLPRKFKVAIAVPPENDVDVFAHCCGFIAIVEHGKLKGYNVCAGGGLGTSHGDKATYPRLSDVLGFCLPDQAVKVVEAIMVVQRDHGERLNRRHARLKYTVEDHGYPWYRAQVEAYCGFSLQEAKPFKFETNADMYGWRKGKGTGLWTYTMFVENGFIHDENPAYQVKSALRELAQTLVRFNGQVSLTANQNIILGAIPDQHKPEIERLLAKWKVDNAQYSAMRLHSMACVALPTCALAMAESQRYLPSLITKLETTLAEVGLRNDAITIRMTGCPNGCGRPYLAEIAFIGKAPGIYNMHLGGGFAGNRLNRIYREGVNEEQILEILVPMLRNYAQHRKQGERFGDFVVRTKVIMPVYHGHSFWAKDESENDTSSRSGTVQLYW